MSGDVEALIAEAVEEFRAALPARAARVAALAAAGDAAGAEAEAHALAGAAGCYGFDAVGEAARAVERGGAAHVPTLLAAAEAACRPR